MAITLVQTPATNTNALSSAATTITLGSNATPGNCLVVVIAADGSTVSGVTLGGSAGNFAAALTVTNTNTNSAIWVDPNCAGGSNSVVVTMAAADIVEVTVFEFSGVLAASPVDKTISGTGTGTTFTSTATATTTQAVEAWVGYVSYFRSGSGTTITGPASPWTNQAQLNNSGGSTFACMTGYQITSATGAATYSGTFAASVTHYAAGVITLKPAPTGFGASRIVTQAVKRAAHY